MTNRATLRSRAATVLAAAAVLWTSACAGSGYHDTPPRPPFPTDVDPCASYCLVWVPPVYVDVPRVCETCPGKMHCDLVKMEHTTFEEVCTPGCYEPRCVPCQQNVVQAVEVSPAHTEWQKVKCDCMCDCWKPVRVPAEYKCCERTETTDGFAYCAYTPPQYDVVAHKQIVCEPRSRYVPAEFGVVYEKQLYAPGHWEWQKKYGCKEPCACPPKKLDCGCGGPPPAPRVGTCDCRGIPAKD